MKILQKLFKKLRKNALIDNAVFKIGVKNTSYDESQTLNSDAIAKRNEAQLNGEEPQTEMGKLKNDGSLKGQAELKLELEERNKIIKIASLNKENIAAGLVTDNDITLAVWDRVDELIAAGENEDYALKRAMGEYHVPTKDGGYEAFQNASVSSGNLMPNYEAKQKYKLEHNGKEGSKDDVMESSKLSK